MKRTLVFDTETTDLVANSLVAEKHQPHVLEFFGAIVDEGGTITDELDFLCNPGVPVTPEITKITGIKPQDVFALAPFKSHSGKVYDLIKSCDSVVAHNLSFDTAVIDYEMTRLGMKAIWPKVQICTVEATEWYFGYRLSLSKLHEHLFGEPHAGAHRAKADVMALVHCFNELRIRGDV